MAEVKLTDSEFEALRHLDIVAWEREEEGQGRNGWALIAEVAEALDVSNVWCSQRLAHLERHGYAERRHEAGARRRWLYGVSAKGERLLRDRDVTREPTGPSKRRAILAAEGETK